MSEPAVWTRATPTEPGHYWFYGRTNRHHRVDTTLVRVFRTSTGSLAFVGDFVMSEDEWSGFWQPAVLPHPPEEAL
jgi:hypothetical protein